MKKLSIATTFLYFSCTLYVSFFYLSDKQEDVNQCCDILRSELKLLFNLEGFVYFNISLSCFYYLLFLIYLTHSGCVKWKQALKSVTMQPATELWPPY